METTQETSIKRFNRHEQMTDRLRGQIMDFISDLICIDDEDENSFSNLKNSMYGLFDGYYYEDDISEDISKLRELGYKGFSKKLEYIISEIKKFKFHS